jgi:hypothetical protein
MPFCGRTSLSFSLEFVASTDLLLDFVCRHYERSEGGHRTLYRESLVEAPEDEYSEDELAKEFDNVSGWLDNARRECGGRVWVAFGE